ncbi:lactate racemase domain-containing protein, partial [Chloroflexota bacterium]
MQKVVLPQLAWYGPSELVLDFPDSWNVEICNIAGYNRPALNSDQIRDAMAKPIDRPPLRDLAKGKNNVVIIFDDLTRGTRSVDIIPHILVELAQAGIEDNNIRLICGLGAHAPMSRIDLAKKVGEDVIAKYTVYNHNAFDNCVYVGTTRYGNKVHVNSEVMDCDLKIAIGSMTPHPFAVFGGAGKIILPAVSSIETILTNHTMPLTDEMRANWDINVRRLDMEEAAAFVKVDMLVDCIMNMWGETVSLYVGDPVSVRETAIVEAKQNYLAKRAEDKDIVITNAYTKASEGAVVLRTSFASVSQRGGDLVLVANAPGGQVSHYL